MADIITKAQKLIEAITFDDCGENGRGGNGGLISRETVRASDELRLELNRIGAPRRIADLIEANNRYQQEGRDARAEVRRLHAILSSLAMGDV
jgi:hypothetical protein